MEMIYEHFYHENPDVPFALHDHTIRNSRDSILHWHDAIELLYFEQGTGVVVSNLQEVKAEPGSMVTVASQQLHRIAPLSESCVYKCLIVEAGFCETLGISLEQTKITPCVQDKKICQWVKQIFSEYAEEDLYHEALVKSYVVQLLIYLARNYGQTVEQAPPTLADSRVEATKEAIQYIRANFRNQITVDDISDHVGFSKYYFSRIFKEISGSTIVEYITALRCENARTMIRSGKYNVSESAEKSGYNNLSYFTRSYKKQYGRLPSEEKVGASVIS